MNRRGTKVRFKPDEKIFGKGAAFKPARLLQHGALEGLPVRRRRDPLVLRSRAHHRRHAGGSHVPFPRRPQGISGKRASTGQTLRHQGHLRRPRRRADGHGSVEWAVAWVADEDGFLNSYCNTIPTPEGGTHENGLRSALSQGPARLTASASATARRADHRRRRDGHGGRDAVGVHPRAGVPGPDQGQARHAGSDPHRRERPCATPSTTGSPTARSRRRKLLDWAIDQAEERLKRKREKEIGRQSATRKLRLPGKLADCIDPARQPAPRSSSSRATAPAARPRARATARRQAILPLARQDPQRRQRLVRRSCRRTSCSPT